MCTNSRSLEDFLQSALLARALFILATVSVMSADWAVILAQGGGLPTSSRGMADVSWKERLTAHSFAESRI